MKITIESTSKIVTINGGIECRVWEGKSEGGVEAQCLIPRIGAAAGQDLSQFERELQEMKPPSAKADWFPLKMIL